MCLVLRVFAFVQGGTTTSMLMKWKEQFPLLSIADRTFDGRSLLGLSRAVDRVKPVVTSVGEEVDGHEMRDFNALSTYYKTALLFATKLTRSSILESDDTTLGALLNTLVKECKTIPGAILMDLYDRARATMKRNKSYELWAALIHPVVPEGGAPPLDPLSTLLVQANTSTNAVGTCYETAVFIEVLVPLIGKGESGQTELLRVVGICQGKLAAIDAFTVPPELVKPLALWTRMLNYVGKCLLEHDVSPEYLALRKG
jgi:hypothetical protein